MMSLKKKIMIWAPRDKLHYNKILALVLQNLYFVCFKELSDKKMYITVWKVKFDTFGV